MLHDVTHEQTRIIITYYNFLWEPVLNLAEWLGIRKKTPQLNWLSHQDIKNLLFLSGWDVYRSSNRMLFPLYIPLLSPLLNKYIGRLPVIRHLCLNSYTFAKPDTLIQTEDYS